MEVGRSKEKRRIVASHCICARVDMTDQADPKKLVSVVAAAQMLEHKKKQLEEAGPSFRPNQILVFPLKLSSDFTPPAPQIYPPFDESPFEMPPRPSVRPTMELPRISSYLPFAFRPFDDNLPQTIYDLPTGTGQLCRIKPPVWQDPILDDDEKVIVPDFEWTDMRLKRQTTPCLSLVPFYKGVELELEPVKQFQTDERHRVYHLPQYIAPELLTFVPMETPEISFENARWLPNRQIKSIDRFLLQQDLGQNPVFVLDSAGSMSGDRWQSLLSNMLDLFSEDGLVRYFTSSFDILVTQNSNVYSFSGGAGPRRQLTSSSDFSCECARSWLLQWVPGGNADMMAAIISALECQPSEIHIITDKHPERSQPILELIRKRCRDGGSSDDDRPRVNCVAFEAHRPACRFLHRMAQMTGGSYREFKLHVAACPLMRQSASVLGMRISGDTKHVDDVEDKELGMAKIFWNKVKDALLRNGIIAWMLDTDKSSNGILPTRDVVRNVKSLLEKAGMSSGEMAEMFLTEDDFGEDEDIDIRDLVRAVVIDGYTKTPHDKPQPPVRFFGLSPKTREVIIQNSDVLLQFFRQVDDDGGEEALCLLPRDVVKALDAFNAEHKLGISEVELVKCSFLVMPSDDGRIDCNELLSFFDKDAAKRAARVQQQSELRKKMSHNKEECECVKSTTYSDDSLIHFLTPEEQHERMEHIRREENEYLAKKQRIEAEIREKNDRQRLEVEAANEASLREAQQDHERRLKEFHDNLDEQVRKDRDAFFERHAAKPTARNTSRVLKNAYDILRLNVSEGNRPGGVPPWTVEELLHIFADPLSLIDERVKREALEERTKAHADALEKMGGTRTVPNILEFNTKTLHATLSNGEGMGRTGLLHDVRDCPICSLAVPLSAETNIEDQEWHMVDVKLMFPHFNDEMMVPEIAYSVQKALARVFIQGDFFVQTTDVELYKLTNTKPGPVEAYNGMKFKLQVQCLIFMHSGLDKCRHAVQRFDTFLKAGELGKTLEHAGFPMKLLKKGKVEFDKPKVSHRPVNQERVESVKVSLDQYEAEWNEYVRALDVEDARQKEADEERLAMHKRLCTAAERENYRRLAVKKRRLQKEHKILLRSINDQNQARLKKYQALLKKENKVLNDEERAKHAAKQAAAEKLFNHDFDQVAENNKMAKHEWEQLKEYNANYHKEKSRLAMAKRDAYKVWQAENKAVKFGNDAMLKAAQDEYDKVEALWIKKFQETANYSKKVHTELKAFVDHRHEEARKKAFGKHQYLYSGQEKANDMLLEASKALYLQTKRDIENANYETEKKYRKKCNEVASINREREQEVLRSKMDAKDHNKAEIDRCNQLFDEQYQMIVRLNEQIRHALNADNLKLIEEIKRDNIFQIDYNREKYLKYYKRDMEHNETVSTIMKQTAEIREQLVACRRFLNVIKRHFSERMKKAGIPYDDPERNEIASCEQVSEVVKSSAAKVFSSWWHEGGPTEQLIIFCRMDPEIEVEHRKRLEHRDDHSHEGRDAERPKGRTSAVLVCAQQGDDEDGEMTPPTRNTGLRFSTPRPPKRLTKSEGSKRRPASARRANEREDAEGLKRFMSPMRRRVPEGKDRYWRMFEQNILHKPYAPPKGSPLEQKPTITPRKEEVKEAPPPKIKPMHLMSWDERMKELERQKKLKEKPEKKEPPKPPPPKDPGDDWTPMHDIFDGEDPSDQPWKQLKLMGTRPNSARPFGSGSPRNFLWNVAAGSKLLPGGSIGTPQGVEALELDSHLERMQLEREERQRRIAAREAMNKKVDGEIKIEAEAPAPSEDPRKALIPTDIFLEALLAAFQHMGVEFDKSSKGANMRITEGDAIIPMLPADYQPNRHVPDDGHLVPTDGRRLRVPKAVQHVGVFAAHKHRPNQTAFRGVHGRWDPAPTEPSREHQALWKTQLYP